MFPETPKTLLKKIAELSAGDDAAEWEAFVELYTSPLVHFVRTIDPRLSEADAEDAVQEVFVRLVDVLRQGKIDRTKAKFRAYLAVLTRRILIDRYREALVRPAMCASGDAADGACDQASIGGSVAEIDPGVLLDARWRVSAHAAAVEQVLTKTAISEQSKAVYLALQGIPREYAALTPHQIAERFGISYAALKQVKSRLDRAVAAVERRMTE